MAGKIVYVIPNLHENGGIQELAKTIYSELEGEFDFRLINWTDGLSLPIRALLRLVPNNIGSYLYIKEFSKHYKDKYNICGSDLIHFWHIEPAMAFLDETYVVSCHGMELLPIYAKSYRKIMYQNVLNNASTVHVVSRYTKDLLMNQYYCPEETVKLIPPCIYCNKFGSIKKNKSTGGIIIGTLTRFVTRKNVSNIIKSLNVLTDCFGLEFKYYLAGDGPGKEAILNELNNANFKWKYFGAISEELKINEFYPSLDIFVMPPLELPGDVEGFGIVYLEANSYGIPVIASRSGGVTDAVKDGVSGIFADPTDPTDIAIKIYELIENRSKYFESSKRWATQFDAQKIARNFSDIYKRNLK